MIDDNMPCTMHVLSVILSGYYDYLLWDIVMCCLMTEAGCYRPVSLVVVLRYKGNITSTGYGPTVT